MKLFLLATSIGIASLLQAQQKTDPTNNFTIEGAVKKGLTISLADLTAYPSYSIDSVVVTNHLHEKKRTIKNIKAVLLKDVLSKAEIDAETPKLFSEFYFACIASDNYKVVFSWNEIFNNELGKTIYIITESDGKPAKVSDDRIAVISPTDYTTGRRYIKGLQKIRIERIK